MKLARTFSQSLSIALVAAVAAVSAGAAATTSAPAHADPLIFIYTVTTKAALAVILIPAALTTEAVRAGALTIGAGLAATSGATTALSSVDVEKKAIAQTTLEDAANYYETGKLSGVLPTSLARMRELAPELKDQSDAQLVDSLVEAATMVIN